MSAEALYLELKDRLEKMVPDFELRYKAELAYEINRLKAERNAVILGHNYMEPALFFSVPDFTGDSLELCRKAATTDKDPIVFCGVRFMAETAKILSPERTVLLPSPRGGCSLAESITAEDVRQLRRLYPGLPVVTYVNTYADVKAESDYCCTSANGEAVVRHLQQQGHDRIIFLPDQYLASNVARETGLEIVFPSRDAKGLQRAADPGNLTRYMVGWQGRCEVHEEFTVDDVENVRRQFPGAVVLAHPECSPEVVAAADFSGSTTAMIRYVQNMESGRYLLLTECSMGDNIAATNPRREMIRMCSVRCPHMKEITLEQTVEALRQERHQIEVPEAIRQRARQALDRMISIG